MKRTIGIAVVLLIGATLTGCIGVKRPDIAVSGFVLDSDTGAGVGGVEVVVGSLGRTVTSENGSWSFSKAKKGAEVSVSKEGWTFQPESLPVKDEGDSLTFSGTRIAYSVSGAVFDQSGAGLEDVLILFANDKDEIVATTRSGSDGAFEKSGLKGTYLVVAFKEGWSFTPGERTVNGEDAEVYFYGSPSVGPSPDF